VTPVAKIAGILRALSDEQLVEAAAGWIAWKLGDVGASEATPPRARGPATPPKKKPTAKLRKELAKSAKTKGGGTVRRETPDGASASSSVFKVLAGSPSALSCAEIAARLEASPSAIRMTLYRLRDRGEIFSAGPSRKTVWAVSQEAADEAAA
jgi:hypothetical protein